MHIEQRQLDAAERALEVLGSLRGIAAMLGQFVASVDPEFIPDEVRPLFERAQELLPDGAPPMDWRTAEKVLREEWGENPSEHLAEVDEEPAAPGATGQVHRGVLHDGREVAVKVQLPGMAERVRTDLQSIAPLVAFARLVVPAADVGALVGETNERVLEELDYEWEADVQRTFSRAYRDHPVIHVPNVVTSLCSDRVLVSEWVEGVEPGARDADDVGEMLFRFYLGSMFHVGVINGDAHPGNWKLMEDGRLAVVDFGATRRVARGRADAFIDVLDAAADGDGERVTELLGALGYEAPAGADWLRVVESACGWMVHDEQVTLDASAVRGILDELGDPYGPAFDVIGVASLPADDVMLGRAIVSLASALAQLGATANWGALARDERSYES